MRRPGIAPASTAAIGSADVGSITQLRARPDDRERLAQLVVLDERDARAALAQDRERALADLQRAHAVGDRLRRAVEPHALARGERAVRVVARRRLGAPDARRRRATRRRRAPCPRAARRRRSGVTIVSSAGASSSSSSAAVPWPEITSQSSNGWISGQPRSAARARPICSRFSAVTPSRSTSAP